MFVPEKWQIEQWQSCAILELSFVKISLTQPSEASSLNFYNFEEASCSTRNETKK